MAIGHFINGEWIKQGTLSETVNPSNCSPVSVFHRGSLDLMNKRLQLHGDVLKPLTGAPNHVAGQQCFWNMPTTSRRGLKLLRRC